MNRLIQFKSSRRAAMLVATVVVIMTCLTVANATQTITTPNAVKISYNLGSVANSAAITPPTNTSVLVMGCCTTTGGFFQAVGQVTLLHAPSTGMAWEGLESSGLSGTGITQSFGLVSAAGTHIVFIDRIHAVDIQVASADTIRVHNDSVYTVAGSVTLIW